MYRKKISKNASNMKFAKTHLKTKSINRTGVAYRGGIRL